MIAENLLALMLFIDTLLVILGEVGETLASQEEDGHFTERLAGANIVVVVQQLFELLP